VAWRGVAWRCVAWRGVGHHQDILVDAEKYRKLLQYNALQIFIA